jgi:hypothetical protein
MADRGPAYKNPWRSLCAYGLIFAAYSLTKLVGAHDVKASVVGHSIQYDVAFQLDPPECVPLAYLGTLQHRDFAVHSEKSAHRRVEHGRRMNIAQPSPNRASIGLGSNLALSANSSPRHG